MGYIGLAIAVCIPTAVIALNLGGYYENQGTWLNLREEWLLQNHNRLRLDIGLEAKDRVSFDADLVAQTFHGATSYNILDLLPDTLTELVPDSLRPMYTISLKDRLWLNNASLSVYRPHLLIRIGKQQLAWGAGYVWNPTELVRPKKLFDPTYEREGTNAVRLSIPWRTAGALEGVILLKERLDSSTFAIRLQENFFGFDLAASYMRGIEESAVLQTRERKESCGGQLTGELLGIGVWGEGARNRLDDATSHTQLVVGGDYTFGFRTYLLAEYFYNGLGAERMEKYTFEDWQRLSLGEVQGLGQDYLFLGAAHPLFSFHRVSLYGLTNLNDRSFVLMPQLEYSLSEDVEIWLSGFYSFGEAGSEYASFGLKGGLFRVRVYF